eukprot:2546837-Prymnesium_polylepis.1
MHGYLYCNYSLCVRQCWWSHGLLIGLGSVHLGFESRRGFFRIDHGRASARTDAFTSEPGGRVPPQPFGLGGA